MSDAKQTEPRPEYDRGVEWGQFLLSGEMSMLRTLADQNADELERLRAENEDLRTSVIAFCGPHAATYARDHELPAGHLFAAHYDLLAKAGARMDDFVRSE